MQVQEIIERLQGYLAAGTLKSTDNIEVLVQRQKGVQVYPLETLQFTNFGIALKHGGEPARVVISVTSPSLAYKPKKQPEPA